MALSDEVMKKISEEIQTDPFGLGYAGKTDTEIAKLLNGSVQKKRIVIDTYPARINTILIGIGGTPNVVSDKDVTDAKKVVL